LALVIIGQVLDGTKDVGIALQYLAMARGGDFRDGSYRKRVWFGKRTVKEGEVCAIWNIRGEHKLVVGPRRRYIFMSDVRFLDRYTADQSEYLVINHLSGEKEHRRGPIVMHMDPVHHRSLSVQKGVALENFEALVVYRELPPQMPTRSPSSTSSAKPSAAPGLHPEVERRVVRGPTLFFPDASEWIHEFSWHGQAPNGELGDKQPKALNFSKLNLTPKQLYVDVKGARTSDDTAVAISLMVFWRIADLDCMLNTTQDPTGDMINALSADVMAWAAPRTYEEVLAQSSALCELITFPILTQRAPAIGVSIDKVVYRGLKTSSHLQQMHNDAAENATKLRLEAAVAEQRERHLDMEARHSSERERAQLSIDEEKLEIARKQAEADHEQKLRHWREREQAELEALRQRQGLEVDFLARLAKEGVNVTEYLVAKETAKPTHHVRVDGAAADLAKVHICAPADDSVSAGAGAGAVGGRGGGGGFLGGVLSR